MRLFFAILSVSLLSPVVATGQTGLELLRQADTLGFENRNWTKAGPVYEAALSALRGRATPDQILAAEIGVLRWGMERNSIAAVAATTRDLLQRPGLSDDLRFRLLRVQGEAYQNLDPGLAEETWTAVARLAEQRADARWVNRAAGEIALAKALQGNIGAFTTAIPKVITTAGQLADPTTQSRWMSIYGQGFIRFGRAAEGLEMCRNAGSVLAGLADVGMNMTSFVCRSQALTALGRTAEALQAIEEGEGRARQSGAVGFVAEWLLERAGLAERAGNRQQALALLREGETLSRQVNGVRLIAESLQNQARLLSQAGSMRDAEETYQRGIAIARQAEDRQNLPRMLVSLGDAMAAQGKHSEALAAYREANDVSEAVLGSISSPWMRQRLLDANRDVYRHHLEALLSGNPQAEDVFNLAEQSRGRAFRDVVTRPAATVNPEVARIQKALWKPLTAAQRQHLLQQLHTAELRNTPGWLRAPITPVSSQDVLRRLKAGEAIVEFVFAETRTAALLFSSASGLRLISLSPRKEIEAAAKALTDALAKSAPIKQPAAALAALILTPLNLTGERLTVIPDGSLHQLPLEVLPGPDGQAIFLSSIISYAPSVAAFLKPPPVPQRPMALAFSAGPKVELASLATRRDRGLPDLAIDLDLSTLAPLPAADAEARMMATALHGRAITSATESVFKREQSGANVLHFALHGVVSRSAADRSALVFLPDQSSEDGLLQAYEIATLPLKASLVTLSSCNSGSGPIGQEGVASLVRPFLGHPSVATVVGTLWPVDDNVSLELMTRFYQQLAQGRDVGTSLTVAKRELAKEFGDSVPARLWAGHVLYGSSWTIFSPAASWAGRPKEKGK